MSARPLPVRCFPFAMQLAEQFECIGPSEASSTRLQVLEVWSIAEALQVDCVDTVSGIRCQVCLRGSWRDSRVAQGDIVRVILTASDGSFKKWDVESQFADGITVDDANNLFILHPDVLLPGSAIADSVTCLRKTVLLARSPGAGGAQSIPAFFGNVIHELFQTIIVILTEQPDFDEMELSMLPLDIVSNKIATMYQLNISLQDTLSVLGDAIAPILDWYNKFFKKSSNPFQGRTKNYNPADEIALDRVQDIEELVWSPCTGLKGKIDATVNICKVDTSSTVSVMELKTGSSKGLAGLSHHAQVALYTLLLSDRYETTVSEGLLSYIPSTYRKILPENKEKDASDAKANPPKSQYYRAPSNESHSVFVKSHRGELVGLVMQRNSVAYYLRPNVPFSHLPPLLSRENIKCSRCFVKHSCMVQNKLLENGSAASMGENFDQSLFTEQTSHLDHVHSEYYDFWRGVLAAEEDEVLKPQKELWTTSAMDREAYGRCVPNLMLLPNDENLPGNAVSQDMPTIPSNKSMQTFVVLQGDPSSKKRARSSITPGDYVLISVERVAAHDSSLGVCPTSTTTWKPALSNGFIHSINRTSVTVILERNLTAWARKQRHPIESLVWRIDAEEIFASHRTAKSNLESLFTGGDEDKHGRLRSLVVNLRAPRFTPLSTSQRAKLEESTCEFSKIGLSLNTEQKKALSIFQQAGDYMLLLGMPGTGKTLTLAAIVMLAAKQGKSILLCSHTHSAVDNVLLKLLEFGFSDFARLGRSKNITDSRIDPYLVNVYDATNVDELEKALAKPAVIATTCLSINHPMFARRNEFDLVVVDEASQILQPICLGPLLFAKADFVLVGDHYQLPPLIRARPKHLHAVKRKAKNDIDNESESVSLFRRLCEAHPEAVVSLTQQYRMAKDIMDLSNFLVYSGCLSCGTAEVAEQQLNIQDGRDLSHPSWIRDVLNPKKRLLFVNTDEYQKSPAGRGSQDFAPTQAPTQTQDEADPDGTRKNLDEVNLISRAIRALCNAGLDPKKITVLSPFRAQVELFRYHFRGQKSDNGRDVSLRDVNLFTVDQYQGRDNHCVFVSFVRSGNNAHVGPLMKDWRRLNVAITRAKQKLVLVGSSKTLAAGGHFLRAMLSFLKESFVSPNLKACEE